MTCAQPLHVAPHDRGSRRAQREGDENPLSEHGGETEATREHVSADRVHVPAVRVLLADREGSARRALAGLLRETDGVVLAGEVGEREDLADALRRAHADALVIDDRLLRDGDHVLAGLGPDRSGLLVLVLGVDDHPAYAAEARRLGADAWVAKDRAAEQLPALLVKASPGC